MLFHSYTFLTFLLAVVVLHESLPAAWRRYLLLVASYTFYGSWNINYTLLILFSTVIDYAAARAILHSETGGRRRFFLVVSLATNLGILGIFKYYNFFAGSLSQYFSLELPLHQLLLPVGISFYTFQSMSYTIDIYRGRIEAARDLVDFALYVSFFPQLVAGPIVRAAEFLPQLAHRRPRTAERIRLGCKLFLFGLFKKMVVADNLALVVERIHLDPTAFSAGDLWVSAYAFAFQIYYDFSAYSEMAIGLAHLFGFTFPENFRRPYCAINISEFWRRWHISLSTWLRDYLYIALGGSRVSMFKTLRNLMITMVLGGLWHGANWTFVVWGFLHGLFLIVHRVFQRLRRSLPRLDRLAAAPWAIPLFVLLTFHCWTLSMVFFRAESFGVAIEMLSKMFDPGADFTVTQGLPLLFCLVLYGAQISQEFYDGLAGFDRLPLVVRCGILVLGFWAMTLLKPVGAEPFLYFQF